MILDDIQAIEKKDVSNMRASIIELPDQINQTWKEMQALDIDDEFRDANVIVFAGMGGSGLGASVAKHLYGRKMPYPFDIVNDYHVPSYVDSESLVIIQSYSGNTEESISAYKDAHRKNAHILTISAGGHLQDLAGENETLHFTIYPEHNPSKQPRMAIGYSVMALLAFLHKLDILTIPDDDLQEIQTVLHTQNKNFGVDSPLKDNDIKKLAVELHGTMPVILAADHLVGSAHVMRNQIHENAKQSCALYSIPEYNHHALESLTFPHEMKERDYYLILESESYYTRNTLQLEATLKIIKQNGHKVAVMKAESTSNLAQVIEIIHRGAYLGYYLALLNDIDPAPIPNVDSFKKMLA